MTAMRKVITRHSLGVVAAVVLILAGFIFCLVAGQYRSQLALRDAAVRQLSRDTDNQAAFVGYFLAERIDDLHHAARSREVAAYFENRALGMSMEYGLRASIQIVAELFDEVRRDKKLAKRPIFERIAFIERDGTPLVECGPPGGFDRRRWRSYLDAAPDEAAVRTEGSGKETRIVISVPCLFKGKYEGELVAWVPLPMLLETFVSDSRNQGNTGLAAAGTILFLPEEIRREAPGLAAIPTGVAYGTPHPIDGFRGEAILAPVEKSPFVLVRFIPAATLHTPARLLYITGGTALFVLILGFVLLRLATRYAVLQARLEETTLREQAVDEKNRELRESQDQLHLANRKLEMLIDTSPLGIIALSEEGRIVLWNRTATATFGFRPKGGATLEPLFRETGEYDAFFESLRREGSLALVEQPLHHQDGRGMVVNITAARLRAGTGDAAYVVMTEDVTHRVELEEQLDHARRMESVGLLAGGIAHDFNNMLSAIVGNVSLAKFSVNDPQVRELLGEAEQGCMRASGLTKQLLTFSRGGTPVKSLVSLPTVVETNARFALSGSSVRLEMAAGSGSGSVEVDEAQIGQVINNLAINAVHAMPDGGTLRISCGRAAVTTGSRLPLAPGEYTTITVADEGSGIPPQVLPKIFDPYFTTKKDGTGLGLATVYSIVKRHGGHIAVESVPGTGTTFTIYLPGGPVADSQAAGRPGLRPAGGGKILVIDDNFAIRKSLATMLERNGFRTEIAADGAEGIRLFREALHGGDPFALVLTDLTIPGGVGGKDAVKELLAIDPEAKVVVTSGYADDPIIADYRAYGFSGVVTKPFLYETLEETLARLLGGDRA